MDLKKFATDMLDMGKGAAKGFAQSNVDFVPTFIILKDEKLSPVPVQHYASNRAFHISMMKMMLQCTEAEAFAFVMEAWFTEAKLKKDGNPINPADYKRPSESADRKECLVVHAGTRDGEEIVLFCEIKRHGHKLVFKDVEDMTAKAEGKSAMSLMSNMFGERTVH